MIGVEPLQPGSASFQATFSSVVHRAGRFFSPLTPFEFGPRHCGQFSAWTTVASKTTRANMRAVRICISSPPSLNRQEQSETIWF